MASPDAKPRPPSPSGEGGKCQEGHFSLRNRREGGQGGQGGGGEGIRSFPLGASVVRRQVRLARLARRGPGRGQGRNGTSLRGISVGISSENGSDCSKIDFSKMLCVHRDGGVRGVGDAHKGAGESQRGDSRRV